MKTKPILFLAIFIFLLQPINMASLGAQEIGLQFYSLREQFKTDVEGTLKTISSWGITKIEGGDSYGVPLEEFKALLAKYDLKVVSIGASFQDLKYPEEVIKKAKSYGATYVMCPWIPHSGDFSIKDAEKAVERFNKAGKAMKEAGIVFTYHAHGYEFRPYGEGTLFDFMAQNARDFVFEMDVYWVQHGGGDPMKVLNTYPDKFVLMHLKDMEKGIEGNYSGHEDVETNVVLGTGAVDIAGLVKRGKELGIKYMFIEDESSRVLEQVPKSLAFLKSL